MEKKIFISFASEDVAMKDFLKGHVLDARTTFEFVDMPKKEPYAIGWKEKTFALIGQTEGVIALVSKCSLTSIAQRKEIQMAREQGKPILAIWAYSDDRTSYQNILVSAWDWKLILDFVNSV